MNVCKECKHSKMKIAMAEKKDPNSYLCMHKSCVDPITGEPVSCLEARNIAFFCGPNGTHYEEKDFI